MSGGPYSRFEKDKLILRDELAVERTLLANERTLLAYLRSAVTLLITGVSIMHFTQHVWFSAVGIISIPVGICIGIVGISRYRKINKKINKVSVRNRPSADTTNGVESRGEIR